MKPKTVTSDRFLTLLLEQLNARFQAADKETVGEGERVFSQTSLPVEFVVSAKKKPKPDSLPEPCCVCFRAGAGFVCVGECCADILIPQDGPS